MLVHKKKIHSSQLRNNFIGIIQNLTKSWQVFEMLGKMLTLEIIF